MQLFEIPPTVCAECLEPDSTGPNGEPEPLCACNGCGLSLHTTCANNGSGGKHTTNVPLSMLVAKGSKWFCEECKTCAACDAKEKGPCLGCGNCEKSYHFSCLNPVPEKKPKCPWR